MVGTVARYNISDKWDRLGDLTQPRYGHSGKLSTVSDKRKSSRNIIKEFLIKRNLLEILFLSLVAMVICKFL